MRLKTNVVVCALVAALFLLPSLSVLSNNDVSNETAIVNEDENIIFEELEQTEPNPDLTTEEKMKEKVVASDKRGLALEVTKLNADPDPEGEDVIDGTTVELEAYVQNHGSDPEEDRAENVEVQFFMDDEYIGNDTAQDAYDNYYIDGGDTGYAYSTWIAEEGTHELKAVADPQGRTGGPTSLSISVTIQKRDYDVDVTCGWPTASGAAGDDVRFYVTVRNNGKEKDTFDLSVVDKKSPGWAKKNPLGSEYLRSDSDDSWVDEVTLETGEVEILYLDVEIPLNLRKTGGSGAPNEEDYVEVVVESHDANSDAESVLLRTTAIQKKSSATPPILIIDDDESSSEPNGENVYWANTAPSWYPVLDKVFEKEIKDAGLSDGNNFIYKKQTNPPSAAVMNNYDLVIWDFGYDWTGDPVASQRNAAKTYLNNGGNILMSHPNCWYGNVDPGAGYVKVDLFKNYFHISHVSTGVGIPRPLVGVAGDEIGGGLVFEEISGATFTRIFDWAPGLQIDPREPGKSTGVFYAKAASADPYVAVKYNDTDLEDDDTDFRTMYMGFSLYDIGDFYGDRNFKDAKDVATRAIFVEKALTWFGVAPKLPDKFDLRTEITDPRGGYVEPGDNSFNDMNFTIFNEGLAYAQNVELFVNITNTDTSGTERYTIDEDNNGNPIEIASRESITISINDWEPKDGDKYSITAEATVSGETYHDNDKDTHPVEAKEYRDIECRAFWYSVEQPYFLAGIENVPVICDALVENKGSRMETFDLKFTVYDPYVKINNVQESDIDKDNDDIYDFSRGVTLQSGQSQHLKFVWTPRMSAGIVDGYTPAYGQAWEYPYQVSISSYLSADEETKNDYTFAELIGGAASNQLGLPIAKYGAVFDEQGWLWTTGDWSTYDLGGTSDEYNEWHVTYTAATSGPNALHAGDDRSSIDQSTFHYDQNLDVWAISPALDMTNTVEATWRNTWHGGLASGDYAYVGYIKDLPDDLDDLDDSETQQNQNTGNYMSGWWLFGNTMTYPIDDGTDVTDTHLYFRMVTNGNSQAAGTYPGWWYDENILHARYASYRSMDVEVQDIYTTPTIGEENEQREITAVVRNSGTDDITTAITDNTPLNVTCTVMNMTSMEYESGLGPEDSGSMQTISAIKRGELVSLTWNWRPQKIGDYLINVTIDFAKDGDPKNNMSDAFGIVRFVYLTEDFEGDDVPFTHGTVDSDGSGVDEAMDEWEKGEPSGILVNTRWGPKSAHSGDQCFGIDLDDFYGEYIEAEDYYRGYGKDSSYLSTTLDLTTAADAKLLFSHWLEIEDSGNDQNIYDKAYVEASIDGGETWDELWKNPPSPDPKTQLYTTFGWKQVTLPLDDYAGKKSVIIRWRFLSDYSVSYAGWYIDDVAVSGRAPLENDAGIESIDSPKPGVHLPLGRNAVVKATVMNYGINELVNCKVIIVVDKTLGGGDPWTEEKYVGTVQNPIPKGGSMQVSFDWPVSDLFNDVEYDITVSTHLTDASDKYIDGYSLNDAQSIRVTAKKDFDVAVESISVFPRLSERGKPRTITGTIVNYGNQEQRFNITLEAKWRQRDISGELPDWEDVDPMEPNPYHGMIHLEAGERLTNWNTTFIPEIYAEYLLTLRASTELISYDYKTGLWEPNDEDEPDENPENNFILDTLKIPKVLWEDDMEWASEKFAEDDWEHSPVRLGGVDDWELEIGRNLGYHGSNASWRAGQGEWSDPYPERLYNNRMNAVLQSPAINLIEAQVESDLGIGFWMKYYIEPMDSRGKYLDSLYLEYLPVNGNPSPQSSDWTAIYIKDYDHTPYNPSFWDPRLFWPGDKGPDTSNSDEYPGNEAGWIYNQIILDDSDMFVKENGEQIDDWFWDGFQFRFRFQTDSNVAYTGPWIDNVGVFANVNIQEPPITKFEANWMDIQGNNQIAYSMNIINSLDHLTELDNILPRDAGIPYDDNDFNIVTFDARKSADPWTGTQGLRYNWDYDANTDSDGDGNPTNDNDALAEEYVDNNPALIRHRFTNFGIFTITLTVTDVDNMENTDTMIVSCGDKPIYDVEIKVEDIFETEDLPSAVPDKEKYGSDETWKVWQGDKVLLSGAGAKDPEGRSQSEFAFRWAFIDVNGDDLDWDDLEWISYKGGRGEPTIEYTFENSGNYHIILEVDDAYNLQRYDSGTKPANLSGEEIAKFSWLDDINITVLPYARQTKTIFISDLDNNVVEVRYDIAYQAAVLTTDDTEGTVNVSKANEPEDSETNRGLRTFIDFQTKKMYNKEGKSGFIWADIIIIYDKKQLPEQLKFEEANVYNPKDPKKPNDHVVLMYYWDKIFNAWVKCDNTMKATDTGVRDLTAVECNVTHFTTIAPMINGDIDFFYRDPSIDPTEIEFSTSPILGRGDEEREVTITAKIRNLGLLPVNDVVVKFKDGDVVIGTTSVNSIPGFGSSYATIKWTVKKDIDIGTHTIKVEIDPNNKIVDNDDSNDIARKKIQVVEAVVVVPSYNASIISVVGAVIAVSLLGIATRKRKK